MFHGSAIDSRALLSTSAGLLSAGGFFGLMDCARKAAGKISLLHPNPANYTLAHRLELQRQRGS
jgi:hypothetical protein